MTSATKTTPQTYLWPYPVLQRPLSISSESLKNSILLKVNLAVRKQSSHAFRRSSLLHRGIGKVQANV
jgi:hypothetical protein